MDVVFDRGDRERPKGHALLYFRSSSDPEEVWAAYLVILPITVDMAKYVPPFLMSQIGDLGPKDLSAFAFPPAPEKVRGYSYLEELAAAREDDVIFGGTINPTDIPSLMMAVNEAVQRYAQVYSERVAELHPTEVESAEDATEAGVNEVLYGLMSDGDKLSELTKLVGRLRFAVEGSEEALTTEAEADLKVLARHLPENLHIPSLIQAAKVGGPRGAKLADFYLKRSFHLIREEYVEVGRMEEEIRALEGEEQAEEA